MAVESLSHLTYLGLFLLIGLLCTIFSSKLRIPNVLILILAGMMLNVLRYKGEPLFVIPQNFIITLGILTLILVVYDSASKFKLKEINMISVASLKLTMFFILFILIFFTVASRYILNLEFHLAFLFASFMAGTSPDTAMALLQGIKSKVTELLELESIVNTPPLVLLPFIIIGFLGDVNSLTFDTIFDQFVPFMQQIIVGIGAGVLVGLVVFKIMSKFYEERLSPIAIIAAALITYVLAENTGGNGVLAVTTMAIIVGNMYLKHKDTLDRFSSTFSEFLQILVFMLLGFLIKIPWSADFLVRSILLFSIFTVIRFCAINASFWKTHSIREKLFMALNAPKGIATAVVIFILSTYAIAGIDTILDYGLAIVLYSIVLSTITLEFSHYFLNQGINCEKERRETKKAIHNT